MIDLGCCYLQGIKRAPPEIEFNPPRILLHMHLIDMFLKVVEALKPIFDFGLHVHAA
jgi:hypothetical protein